MTNKPIEHANTKSFLSIIVTDSKALFRALFFITTLLTISLGIIYAFFYWYPDDNLEVSFTDSGATIIKKSGETYKAQFLLPASSTWTDTGIDIPPRATVNFRASGRVHLAIHKLIQSANNDSLPLFNWLGPRGAPYQSTRQLDKARRSLLIENKANIGAIIGFFKKSTDIPPGPSNHRPKGKFIVDLSDGGFKNDSDEKVRLWLVVNDMYLDPNNIQASKDAYIGKDKKKEPMWNYIESKDYWHIWFDDNIGHYLVQVEFS